MPKEKSYKFTDLVISVKYKLRDWYSNVLTVVELCWALLLLTAAGCYLGLFSLIDRPFMLRFTTWILPQPSMRVAYYFITAQFCNLQRNTNELLQDAQFMKLAGELSEDIFIHLHEFQGTERAFCEAWLGFSCGTLQLSLSTTNHDLMHFINAFESAKKGSRSRHFFAAIRTFIRALKNNLN